MNKNHTRGNTTEMRRHISLKFHACPASRGVYLVVMSGDVSASCPGRSGCPLPAELPASRGGGWTSRSQQRRQWKRGRTRMKGLRELGLDTERVRAWAFNGRGPWWNARASYMNAALPGKWFRQQELVFMVEIIQRYQEQASS